MKKTAIATSSIVLLLFAATNSTQAFSSKINVSTSGNSESSVHVESNSSSNYSDTSTIQSNSHSKVTITCDGKTYTYESDGSINESPCDGAKVNINNNGSVRGATSSDTPDPTAIKERVEQKKAEVKKKIDEEKAKIKATITSIPKETSRSALTFDLGTWIRSFISSIFSSL